MSDTPSPEDRVQTAASVAANGLRAFRAFLLTVALADDSKAEQEIARLKAESEAYKVAVFGNSDVNE